MGGSASRPITAINDLLDGAFLQLRVLENPFDGPELGDIGYYESGKWARTHRPSSSQHEYFYHDYTGEKNLYRQAPTSYSLVPSPSITIQADWFIISYGHVHLHSIQEKANTLTFQLSVWGEVWVAIGFAPQEISLSKTPTDAQLS